MAYKIDFDAILTRYNKDNNTNVTRSQIAKELDITNVTISNYTRQTPKVVTLIKHLIDKYGANFKTDIK